MWQVNFGLKNERELYVLVYHQILVSKMFHIVLTRFEEKNEGDV